MSTQTMPADLRCSFARWRKSLAMNVSNSVQPLVLHPAAVRQPRLGGRAPHTFVKKPEYIFAMLLARIRAPLLLGDNGKVCFLGATHMGHPRHDKGGPSCLTRARKIAMALIEREPDALARSIGTWSVPICLFVVLCVL